MLEPIPTEVDVKETWLVQYCAEKLGISRECLLQSIRDVGPQVSKLKRHVSDGCRIALASGGKHHLVIRIKPLADGFAIFVPYYPESDGLLIKIPQDYSKKEVLVPLDKIERFRVSSNVKLSFHMTGFVQFSTLNKPIISGYNHELKAPKGIGLRADNSVRVVTGPLCSVQIHNLADFTLHNREPAIHFGTDDLWRNVLFEEVKDASFNFEFFMFSKTELPYSPPDEQNRRIYSRNLPFNGSIQFPFALRIIEIPHMDFFLGVIVSNCSSEVTWTEGYTLGGPGCFDEHGNAFGIHGQFPAPSEVMDSKVSNLDFNKQQGLDSQPSS